MRYYQLAVLATAFFGTGYALPQSPRYTSKYLEHPQNQGYGGNYPKYWLNQPYDTPPPQGESNPVQNSYWSADQDQPRARAQQGQVQEQVQEQGDQRLGKNDYSPPRYFPNGKHPAKDAIAAHAGNGAETEGGNGAEKKAQPQQDPLELAIEGRGSPKSGRNVKIMNDGTEDGASYKKISKPSTTEEKDGGRDGDSDWNTFTFGVVSDTLVYNDPYEDIAAEGEAVRKTNAMRKIQKLMDNDKWHEKRDLPLEESEQNIKPVAQLAKRDEPENPPAKQEKSAGPDGWPDHIKVKAEKMMKNAASMQDRGSEMIENDKGKAPTSKPPPPPPPPSKEPEKQSVIPGKKNAAPAPLPPPPDTVIPSKKGKQPPPPKQASKQPADNQPDAAAQKQRPAGRPNPAREQDDVPLPGKGPVKTPKQPKKAKSKGKASLPPPEPARKKKPAQGHKSRLQSNQPQQARHNGDDDANLAKRDALPEPEPEPEQNPKSIHSWKPDPKVSKGGKNGGKKGDNKKGNGEKKGDKDSSKKDSTKGDSGRTTAGARVPKVNQTGPKGNKDKKNQEQAEPAEKGKKGGKGKKGKQMEKRGTGIEKRNVVERKTLPAGQPVTIRKVLGAESVPTPIIRAPVIKAAAVPAVVEAPVAAPAPIVEAAVAGHISQINDGQVQLNPLSNPLAQVAEGQIKAGLLANQIADGQIQLQVPQPIVAPVAVAPVVAPAPVVAAPIVVTAPAPPPVIVTQPAVTVIQNVPVPVVETVIQNVRVPVVETVVNNVPVPVVETVINNVPVPVPTTKIIVQPPMTIVEEKEIEIPVPTTRVIVQPPVTLIKPPVTEIKKVFETIINNVPVPTTEVLVKPPITETVIPPPITEVATINVPVPTTQVIEKPAQTVTEVIEVSLTPVVRPGSTVCVEPQCTPSPVVVAHTVPALVTTAIPVVETAYISSNALVVNEVPVTKTGVGYITPQIDVHANAIHDISDPKNAALHEKIVTPGKIINKEINANGIMNAEDLEAFWRKQLPHEFD